MKIRGKYEDFLNKKLLRVRVLLMDKFLTADHINGLCEQDPLPMISDLV